MTRLNRFNWIARNYDRVVKVMFGDALHRAQMNFVSQIGSEDNVLILGGGSGKFLKALVAVKPSITVTYIEASSEMIALAKREVSSTSRIKFIHGTQLNIPQESFDTVITNFFLDLFTAEEIQPLVNTVSENLRAGGKWFVTDFEKTPKFQHRFLLSLMYQLFGITGSLDAKQLPDWRPIFKSEGLKLKEEIFFRKGFVSASVFVKDSNY